MNAEVPLKILWLDDNLDEVISTVDVFINLGFEVIFATNTLEALYQVEHQNFDLIISDLFMPPPDGTTFLSQAIKLQPNTLFFVVSGYGHNYIYRKSLDEMVKAGTKIHIFKKPILPDKIISALAGWLPQDVRNMPKEKKSLWRKVFENIEVKPGIAGISIDLKGILLEFNGK